MQEQVNEKSVSLVIRGSKLTGRMLAKAMRLLLAELRKQKQKGNQSKTYKGKQTIKQLTKNGSSLANIEITEKNIKSFERVARKYGIDFSLKLDRTDSPPKWIVFFKSKDEPSMTAAFKEYSAKTLQKTKQKPSLLAALRKMKELAKNLAPDKVKNKEKGAR